MQPDLTVFLNCAPWDLRSRNTDWRYLRYVMPRLAEFEPGLRFVTQGSAWISLLENAKTVRKAAGWRVGLPLGEYAATTGRLSGRDLRRSKADVVFTHEYPLNAGDVPVLWQNAIVDPQMQRNFGVSADALQSEIDAKRPLFHRAARVQVQTLAEAERHRQMFPESADRFVAVPYFTPHLRACPAEMLNKHRQPGPVRILFVGNNARRKGLPELLEAFLSLPQPVLDRARLTVLSNFDRSPMDLPTHPNLQVVRGANRARVLVEMQAAHILVNVAHFESYGIVFLEAMSQGVVCMGPAWEVQRELLDNGKAGLNLSTQVPEIRSALQRLIEDAELRSTLARAGWERFQQRYAPDVVAAAYRDLLLGAIR